MELEQLFEPKDGDFCRVFRDVETGRQYLFLLDRVESEEGGDLPCLSIKVDLNGAILTANQFAPDTEAGNNFLKGVMQTMREKKAAVWIEQVGMGEIVGMFDSTLGDERDE